MMTPFLRRLRSVARYTAVLLLPLLLTACSFPGVMTSTQQLPQVRQQNQATPLPPIRFPQDEGTHNDLTEWWYYTGHLEATTANGKTRRYGFELVVFQAQRSTIPPVYAAHFAISDISRQQFHYDQRRQVEPNTSSNATAPGIDVHVGNWSIQGLNGRDHLTATMNDYTLALNLVGTKAPILHNGNGLITYGLAGFSYYYSRTRMTVNGTLIDHNQPLKVRGLAWMDHQWGNFLTLGGGGWDWYSLQFNNDTEMMIYFIRDATGKALATYAGYIDEQGNDNILPTSALHTTVLSTWTSATTGITYPSGWRLAINDLHIRTTLTITPQIKNQELVTYSSTGNTYWEGAVTMQGQGNSASSGGQGYVELTGYTK